ncbi:magnesium-translocating P-type ATPase [Vampirovibrio chlorellavorus]|uniref:magnesium-translocating P-type ATPase n=1 Tax=Vampirovibrio chlorellavorus TaxID=758823 RepID=UPI0026EC13C6|nr:magnesium-translocating P-type ATPase [Vampirovibrio chlorellavorus]
MNSQKSEKQTATNNPEHRLAYFRALACMSVAAVLKKLKTETIGLTDAEAQARLSEYGLNEITREQRHPWLIRLMMLFNSPFNYLLMVLGLLSYVSGNRSSAIMIAIMVLLSVLLRFIQESRSNRAAEELQALVTSRVNVRRRHSGEDTQGASQEIPLNNLVPGDIITLGPGDLIPADVRLIEARDLHINQSALSGEAFPVEKKAEPDGHTAGSLIDLGNLCFMGTSVVSGMAVAVALATGDQTYFGNLAAKIVEDEPPTSFDQGINKLSWLLIRFITAMVLVIFLINGLTKHDWLTALLFALAVGVGLTPEMLPMILITNLSRGAIALSRQKVIVKRLASIQNLGAIDVLCTDKTGTLTQNKVILYRHLDLHGQESIEVLKAAYLNSYFESGLKNLLDDAIMAHAEQDDALNIESDYVKVDEIPFDFERRRLSVVIAREGKHTLICKGAIEEMLSVCVRIHDKDREYPITPAIRAQIHKDIQKLGEEGFRTIAVACKNMDVPQKAYTVEDEQALTLLGYIAFLDPPKESTAQAISALSQLGVTLKILTGDNEWVTRKICTVVGLPIQGILLGRDIESLSPEQLAEQAEHTTIFAKLTPEHKERVIQAIQQKGHVVGFLGDGINDSPALHRADVGVSVANAVDIARESADMILLEQSLLVLKDGVIEGRKVFGNIIKYIRMTTSSNFGNVFSMVGASFLLPFLPMMPIQILAQNLLYDISQTAIPFDRVDEAFLARPHRWEVPNVERFMLTFGPVSSIFDYVLFAVMWFVFQANTEPRQALFHTGWFIEGLLSQVLIVHFIRTASIPFLQSWAAPQLLVMTGLIIAVGIYLPHSPLAPFFGFVTLPAHYFAWLVGILAAYFVLIQVVKRWFIGKFGYD